MKLLGFKVVGLTLGVTSSALFTLCILWDLVFPGLAMTAVWRALLPGYEDLSAATYLLGLFETFFYGLLLAGIFVPLYNWLQHNQAEEAHP